MAGPMFPSLLPKVADPLWFNVDKPCDDESELTKLEEEHAAWVGWTWKLIFPRCFVLLIDVPKSFQLDLICKITEMFFYSIRCGVL